jgi:hypothetical protein
MKKQVLQRNIQKSKCLLERQERCEQLDAHVTEVDSDADDV